MEFLFEVGGEIFGDNEITGDLLGDLLLVGDRSTGEAEITPIGVIPRPFGVEDPLSKSTGEGGVTISFEIDSTLMMATGESASENSRSSDCGGRVLCRNFLPD